MDPAPHRRAVHCIVQQAWIGIALTLAVSSCAAHGDLLVLAGSRPQWGVVVPLLASAWLYFRGATALWRASRPGAGVTLSNAACFACGWLAAAVALVSPLDALAGRLFWVHMVQHELLMLVAAPLLVLARPVGAFGWALPARCSRGFARLMHRPLVRRWWRALTAPVTAWSLHAAALWLWHVPALFNAAQASASLHAVQHLSFFVTAIVFWWACLGRGHGRAANGSAVLYLLTTMIHTGVLGALLTLSGTAWYASAAPAYGLTPLEDQQLGGLVMWIPAGAVYMGIGLALFARWLGRAGADADLGARRRA